MNKDQDIEKLFRDTFQDFEVSPPLDLKTKIDGTIAALEKKRKRRFLLFFFIFVGICLLGFTWIGLQFNQTGKTLTRTEKQLDIQTKSEAKQKSTNDNSSTFKQKASNKNQETTSELKTTARINNKIKEKSKTVNPNQRTSKQLKKENKPAKNKKARKERKNLELNELVPMDPDQKQKNDLVDEYKDRIKLTFMMWKKRIKRIV